MSERLTAQGAAYGIEYHFDEIQVVNSLDAHRLIHWVKSYDLADELNEVLMIAHFTDGTDLSKTENLLAIVEKIKLNANDAKKLLTSDQFVVEVKQDIAQSKVLGVRGVPYFLIGDERVSGTQDEKVSEQIIAAALENQALKQPMDKSGVCVPDKGCEVN